MAQLCDVNWIVPAYAKVSNVFNSYQSQHLNVKAVCGTPMQSYKATLFPFKIVT